MNDEGQPLKLGRQPAFYKADVMRRFGEVGYKCMPTFDSWLHILRFNEWSVYVDEFDDEAILNIYKSKEVQVAGIAHKSAVEALDYAQLYVQNGV